MDDLFGMTVFAADVRAAEKLKPDFSEMGTKRQTTDRNVCRAPQSAGLLLAQKRQIRMSLSHSLPKHTRDERMARMAMLHNEADIQVQRVIHDMSCGDRLCLRSDGWIVALPPAIAKEVDPLPVDVQILHAAVG